MMLREVTALELRVADEGLNAGRWDVGGWGAWLRVLFGEGRGVG